jgi:periplasmic protein TonB
MSNEEKRNSGVQIGTLGGCLIEGDSEQKARERKIKRRALGISIALQSLVLVGLVLTPLLGKTEKLPPTITFVPMPPYYHSASRPVELHPTTPTQRNQCSFCAPTNIPPTIVTHDNGRTSDTTNFVDGIDIGNIANGQDRSGLLDMIDNRRGPDAPIEQPRNQTKRLVVGHIEPAMIVRRVEPLYPPLMKQIHRAGRVELRAIISTEGEIESLQAVSGDAAFYASALEAVRQWKYRPTQLNGQPVEVETVITVVYTLNQ